MIEDLLNRKVKENIFTYYKCIYNYRGDEYGI